MRWADADPAELQEERIRDYFLYLKRDRAYASQSMRLARVSLSTFYIEMLGRDWGVFDTIRTKDVFKLPTVLTQDEVSQILGAVREPRFRVCLRLIYQCGLRLSEALHIECRDIHRESMRLHIRQGFLTRGPIGRATWQFRYISDERLILGTPIEDYLEAGIMRHRHLRLRAGI